MRRALALVMLCTLSAGGAAADLHALVRNDKGQPVAEAVVIAVPEVAAAKPPRPKL